MSTRPAVPGSASVGLAVVADDETLALDRRPAQGAHDVVGRPWGDVDERVAVGDLDGADRRPRDARLTGDRADEVARTQPGSAPAADEEPRPRAVPTVARRSTAYGTRAGRPPWSSVRSAGLRARPGEWRRDDLDRFVLRVPIARPVGEAHGCKGDVDHVELFGEGLDHRPEAVDPVVEERLADVGPQDLQAARALVRDGRGADARQPSPDGPFDVGQKSRLAGPDQGDRHTGPPRSPGPADPMDIGVGVRGNVVVDDVRDVLDIEAASGDVGGDEDVDVALAEPRHDPVPLLLGHAAVECAGVVATAA